MTRQEQLIALIGLSEAANSFPEDSPHRKIYRHLSDSLSDRLQPKPGEIDRAMRAYQLAMTD